jgi:predicted HTH domain antitoxin
MEPVATRMGEGEVALLDRLVAIRGSSRNEVVREAVSTFVRDELVEVALERYRTGEVGMRGAAEIAGRTIGEMMAAANERNVLSNADEGSLEGDVQALR